MQTRPPVAMEALDRYGLDAICDDIIDGKSYAQICQKLEIGKSAMSRWLAMDSDRSARVAEALRQSAQGEDDKAELTLLDKTMDIQRARELAFHYRWRARVRNPHDYGEKVQIDQTTRVVNLSEEEILRQRETITKRLAEGAEGPAES